MDSPFIKKIVTIMFIACIGLLGYKFFFSSAETPTSPTESGEAQNILDLATKLDSVHIDSTLFASPIFTSLRDFTPPLLPEPQGRPDPFTTIGNDTGGFVIAPAPKTKGI